MSINNFCFLSEAHYPNYAKRIQEYSIPRFLSLNLDVPFYISTNCLSLFSKYTDHPLIKVFDIEQLRANNPNSQKYELLPEDPTGLYPARYPWNLRRFILEQAVNDGFVGLFFIECDTKIHPLITNKEQLYQYMLRLYEENTVKTSSARFSYIDRSPSCVFDNHQKYIEDLKLTFSADQYDSLDGTNQLFFGKDTYSLKTFLNHWHFICDYGYEKSWGYRSGYLSNLSFVIPMSNFRLIHTETPFITEHVFEDRY
jgi:hypothetical protein